MATKVHDTHLHLTPKWNSGQQIESNISRAAMPKRGSSAVGRHSRLILKSTSSHMKVPSPTPVSSSQRLPVAESFSDADATADRLQSPRRTTSVISVRDNKGFGGLFNSRTKVKSVLLPSVYNPLLPTSSRHHRCVSIASPRFLPQGVKSRASNNEGARLEPIRVSQMHLLDSTMMKQSERLKNKELELKQVKRLRQSSESVPHRLDRLYVINGASFQPKDRYHVSDEELQRLRDLSLSRNKELYFGKGVSSQARNVTSKTLDKFEQRLSGTDSTAEGVAFDSDAEKMKEQSPVTDSSQPHTSEEIDMSQESEKLDGQEDDEAIPGSVQFVVSTSRKQSELAQQDAMTTLASRSFVKQGSKLQIQELTVLSDDDQKAAYAEIFKCLCKDGDSEISVVRLQKKLLPNASASELSDFYLVFDLNGDKTISIEEFQAVLALNDQLNGTRTTDPSQTIDFNLSSLVHLVTVYKEMFDLLDDDGNGYLNIRELLLLLSAGLGHEIGGDPALAQRIMHTMDKDENGRVEFTEFLNYIPFFLALHGLVCSNPFSLDSIEVARDTMRQRIESTNSTLSGKT